MIQFILKSYIPSKKLLLIISVFSLYSCKNSNRETNLSINADGIENILDHKEYKLVWHDEFDYSGNPDQRNGHMKMDLSGIWNYNGIKLKMHTLEMVY